MSKLGGNISKIRIDHNPIAMNFNMVRPPVVVKTVYERFIKLAQPNETLTQLMERLSNSLGAPKKAPKTICGIKLRKRHN